MGLASWAKHFLPFPGRNKVTGNNTGWSVGHGCAGSGTSGSSTSYFFASHIPPLALRIVALNLSWGPLQRLSDWLAHPTTCVYAPVLVLAVCVCVFMRGSLVCFGCAWHITYLIIACTSSSHPIIRYLVRYTICFFPSVWFCARARAVFLDMVGRTGGRRMD